MRIVYLAAGSGTRLRPLTDDRPKCMVELAGPPLLHWSIAAARQAGCTDIVIVGGYRREALQLPGITLLDNPDFATTNMVHTLWCAREALSGNDVIVSYSDILYEPRVLTALMATPGDVAVTVDRGWLAYWQARFADPLSDAESLRVKAGRIVDIGNKETELARIEGQYIGLLKFSRRGVDRLLEVIDGLRDGSIAGPKPFERLYMTDLLQVMIGRGIDVLPAWTDRGWIEIDSMSDLRLAEALFKPKGTGPAAGFRIAD
jgi:choline kinase